jgi:hypothetical protein
MVIETIRPASLFSAPSTKTGARQMGWWWLVLWLSTGVVVPIVWLLELLVLHARKRVGWAALLRTDAVSPVAAE